MIFQVTKIAFVAGRVKCTTAVPTRMDGKVPLIDSGMLCVSTGAVALETDGMPFAANNCIAISNPGTPTYFHDALGFSGAGKLCMDTAGAIDHYVQGGVPVTANGAIAIDPTIDP